MTKLFKVPLLLLLPVLAQSQINTSPINQTGAILQILCVADSVLSEDNYTKADNGLKFIAVKVRLDNTLGNSPIYFSFLDLALMDANKKIYGASFKTYVVRQPYIASAIVQPGSDIFGWVTFEVPHDLIVYSLQMKWNRDEHCCLDWIPFWPLIANVHRTKKFAKQVSIANNQFFPKTKNIILTKTIRSIDNYLNYIKTKQSTCFINGIKHASHAKLLFESIKTKNQELNSPSLTLLHQIITLLNENLPQKIMQQQSTSNSKSLSVPLQEMRNAVIKNYITKQKIT